MLKYLICLLFTTHTLLSDDSDQLRRNQEIYAEHVGFLTARALKTNTEWIDLEAVMRGIKKYISNDKSMENITKDTNFTELLDLEQSLFEYQATENLKKSEAYLQTISTKENIQSIDNGKIFYEILHSGHGSSQISGHDVVTIRYSLTDLNGDKIGFSLSSEPCTIDLQDIIPGLVQGMTGMIQGEIRKIYLHPDKAYGTQHNVPPNSYVIAEVELLEIHRAIS